MWAAWVDGSIFERGQRQVFSDNESKIQKYWRVLTYLFFFFPVLMITLMNVSQSDSPILIALGMIVVILLLVYTFAVVFLFRRILQLKNKL